MDRKLLEIQVRRNVLATVVKTTGRHAMTLEKLVHQLITTKTCQPEMTHQIRILSNKTTEALRLLSHAGIDIDSKEIKKKLYRLRRSLGLLRDADIRVIELHTFIRKRRPANDDAMSGAVHFSWSLSYLKTMTQLRRDWHGYRKSFRYVRSQCKTWLAQHKEYPWRKRHHHWVIKQFEKWSRHAEKMTGNEKVVHDFRSQTKQLRYLLQYLLPEKVETVQSVFISLLKQIQQELGRYWDLKNIIAWLEGLRNSFAWIQTQPLRLVSTLSSWRRSCEAELRRNEKQLLKLRAKIAQAMEGKA